MLAAALLCLSASAALQAPQPKPGRPVTLPTEYFEHRFVVTPTSSSGKRLRLFTDTGGGILLAEEDAKEMGLQITSGEEGKSAPFPTFRDDSFIPPALESPFYLVTRKEASTLGEGLNGMLGQQWFAGRVWTFDYPRKKLLWRAPGDLPKHAKEHEVKLHFQADPQGVRKTNFARIEATIDGETLSFLLDTGATNILTPEPLRLIDDGRPANRATSFVTTSVYDRWHGKHPDWKTIETKTLTGKAMIEVPKITVGGFEVGPVWFTVQSDKAFHEYMAQWMDQPTEGALGGSAFKYLRMTVDWPNAVAVFEKK